MIMVFYCICITEGVYTERWTICSLIMTGDFRNSALIIHNADGSDCCDLRYVGHEIKNEKYRLPGLPAVYTDSEEAQTLEIYLEDRVSYVRLRGLEPQALYRDAESGRCYYGADLMEAGLPMPVEQKEYPAYQIELVREQ